MLPAAVVLSPDPIEKGKDLSSNWRGNLFFGNHKKVAQICLPK